MRNKLFLILSVAIILVIIIGLVNNKKYVTAECADGFKYNEQVCKNGKCNYINYLVNPCSNHQCGTDNDCVKNGCSGELCTYKGNDVRTACLYLPEYQCLKYLPCSCVNNKCQFQENDDHLNCLDNIKR
jgi:eight-cysteine-cluster-containing protein